MISGNYKLDIISSSNASMLYRFQGGNSYPSFNIKGDDYRIKENNQYTYFSKSIDHHKYFVSKRLRQIISKTILDDKGLVLSNRQLADVSFFKKVQADIASTDKLSCLESLRFLIANDFLELIEQNYEYNSAKTKNSRIIERVDRRVYGGGYGIGDDWLNLFNLLTISYSLKVITRDNLIYMLRAIRSGYKSKLETVSFLDGSVNQVYINGSIYSDFTKFRITEVLESIIDKGLYKKESEFGKNPSQVIKRVNTNYIKLRDETLHSISLQKK